MINKANYEALIAEIPPGTTLVAVSKTKPADDIRELYALGQRDFGENYVQELTEKQAQLPADIRWHFIGHLQSNKVKYIAPFVYCIQGVDSSKLLQEINRQGAKINRTIRVLLQVHIAREETKFGMDEAELNAVFSAIQQSPLTHVHIAGLMGMASFSTDTQLIKEEFRKLKTLYDKYAASASSTGKFDTLSMGMSADYRIAIESGSNTIRVGSLLFGERDKKVS